MKRLHSIIFSGLFFYDDRCNSLSVFKPEEVKKLTM